MYMCHAPTPSVALAKWGKTQDSCMSGAAFSVAPRNQTNKDDKDDKDDKLATSWAHTGRLVLSCPTVALSHLASLKKENRYAWALEILTIIYSSNLFGSKLHIPVVAATVHVCHTAPRLLTLHTVNNTTRIHPPRVTAFQPFRASAFRDKRNQPLADDWRDLAGSTLN
ncbi:hypothetical protein G3M48_008491 [Beauveria asiatica]|uniref:Uncharacterized protein n=1 Tax=Beauveria asiatica TaxID=1069075 RepID=A0AAW0S4F8_9HYPO